MGDYVIKKNIEINNLVKSADLDNNSIRKDKFKPLIKIARGKYDSRVLKSKSSNIGDTSSSIIDTDELKGRLKKAGLSEDSFNPKLRNAIRRHKKLIFVGDADSPANLAHELGHLQNAIENKELARRSQDQYRSNLVQSLNTSGGFNKIDRGNYKRSADRLKTKGTLDTGIGVKETFKRFKDKTAIVREEDKATKRGLNLLKNLGANNEESIDSMIILRQKNYTWSEFGKAVKSIGIGAATGATIGFGPFKRHSKIGAAIGGAIGAGLGASMYHELHKNRLKAKKKVEELKKELGDDLLGYLKGNLPKNYPDIVKLVDDLNKLRKDLTNKGTTGELSGCYIWLKSINLDNDSDLIDYLQYCELHKDEIPIVEVGATSFGDCIDSSYVVYNIKSKKFYSRAYKVNDLIPGLRNFLLGYLEIMKETVEESTESEKEDNFYNSDYLDEIYKTWLSEYYEKAKNLIKQARL